MSHSSQPPRWRPAVSTDVVSFDCDATLSQIEGIDWLAERAGHGPAVEAMTHVAMQETGINDSLYRDRLDLVRPNTSQIGELVSAYHANLTPDAGHVIKALRYLGKTVCVLSAGLKQPVVDFAEGLGVETQHIEAVPLRFGADGGYLGYEEDCLFIRMDGKASWLQTHFPNATRLHIGDGLNDVTVREVGVRLIGFGGGRLHPRVAQYCSEYIEHNTLAPLLSLTLTQEEVDALPTGLQTVVEIGDQVIINQGVHFESTFGSGVC